jgi:predicted enzyme related to lactoylglutathione lyase
MDDFKVIGLNTIIVQVKDLEKSTHFYEHVLQLKKDMKDKNMAFFALGPGNGRAKLLLHTSEKPEPTDKGMVMELLVDNVDAAVASIESNGGRTEQQPVNQDWGVREAVIADPDGYKIWLSQQLT